MTRQHQIRKACTRAVSLALAAVLMLPTALSMNVRAVENETPKETSSFQFTYPLEHSFQEINQYYAEHPYDTSLADEYDIIPDIANEELNAKIDAGELNLWQNTELQNKLGGRLSDKTLTNALNATNYIRYAAGVQLLTIHTADGIGGRQGRAQLGAALLAELGQMTHNVSQADALAAGIVNGVWGWAKAGPGGSNCVQGIGVANKMVNSFMPDVGNDGRGLSHRSYMLNPQIASTGFGAANLSGKNKAGNNRGTAVTMYVTFYDSDPYGINAVMWPARRQPIENFQARGSWTMNIHVQPQDFIHREQPPAADTARLAVFRGIVGNAPCNKLLGLTGHRNARFAGA